VYECSGAAGALDAAALLARPGGNVTMLGVPGGPVTVDPRLWLARETTVAASLAHTNAEFSMTLALLADGRLRVRPLHDRTIGLDELDETLAALASGESQLTKVLVDPTVGS
jgi:threonine dehydrogenase-like Zn-dependent dehydrogenase